MFRLTVVIKMIAKIVADRVIVRGEKCFEIKLFDGMLSERELPKLYTDYWRKPQYYLIDNKKTILLRIPKESPELRTWLYRTTRRCCEYRICIGDVLTENQMAVLLPLLEKAGQRLERINRRLATENAGWDGRVSFEI
jgi:hypothetical protein